MVTSNPDLDDNGEPMVTQRAVRKAVYDTLLLYQSGAFDSATKTFPTLAAPLTAVCFAISDLLHLEAEERERKKEVC